MNYKKLQTITVYNSVIPILKGIRLAQIVPVKTFMPLNRDWRKELPCSLHCLQIFLLQHRCPTSALRRLHVLSSWCSNFLSNGSLYSFESDCAAMGLEVDSIATEMASEIPIYFDSLWYWSRVYVYCCTVTVAGEAKRGWKMQRSHLSFCRSTSDSRFYFLATEAWTDN